MEYTWSELDGENIGIEMGGHTYRPLAGPEEARGQWWAPGYDEAGTAWDMFFTRTGMGETEGFALKNVERADL